ncbi:epidermal growth factor receptor kinase substrate 8-like protein 1 isoform X5 [Ostrea edulis]|uniref:epidermal growth factor receptor kinase substrate 8-like protein 1 isoform X5 n=1 Tax=Ostrea edulis TaxID=37623 RepID=UPI0024AF7EDE|nr:epidermal growth factor receptor kinase substrate 8-like protein 1 isoform X5 [Ostrea edulis]
MNGYDHYGRNGFHPVNSGDPYNHSSNHREMDFNSPRRSVYDGSVFGISDLPTPRDDPYDRNDFGRSQRNGFDLDRNSFDGRYDMRDTRDEAVMFELDHLATFSSRTGAMSAEDGLRKLRQMEGTTGIWTMRCTMIVERKPLTLVILDKSNGEELERFPLDLVHEPTAIFKDDKREIYTNLILFTVLEDPRRRNGQADMHIFQSIVTAAQDIVDEIQAAKDGRLGGTSGQRIPPPPMGPAPNPPRFGDETYLKESAGLGRSDFYTQQSARDNPANNFVDDEINYRQSSRQAGGIGGLGQTNRASFMPSDMDSGQNEILERDVQLLNACFDDIEKFVSRLQQAAEAYKELERRRKDRSNKKSKNNRQTGDGMLNMRAKPPPADDFIDIFEKFKFAFNLLAKLKAHIHDPNAPELVHFLFTPLSLIYEASRDPVHGGRDLAESATRPNITQDARQLLLNCLTSKELELWQSLGKSWTASRDNYGDNYTPRFYNGWTPAVSAPVDKIDRSRMEDALMNHERQIRDRDMEDRARREGVDMVMPFPSSREEDRNYIGRSNRYDQYSRPPEDNYARSTKRPSTPPPGVPFTNPNVARYQEHVEQHINRNREVHEPRVSEPRSKQDMNMQFAREVLRSNGRVMEAVHDRQGRNAKEITVEKGDLLQVLDDTRNWWKLKNNEGHIGYAPYTILKEYVSADSEMDKRSWDRLMTRGRRSSGEYNSHIPTNGAPAPPAPPPPPHGGSRRQEVRDKRKGRGSSDRRRRRSDDYSSGSASDEDRRSYGRGSNRRHSPRDDSDEWSRDSSDRERPRNRSERQSDKRRQRSPPMKHSNPPSPRYGDSPRYNDKSPRRKDPPPPPPPPSSRPLPLRGHKDKRKDDLHDELQQFMSQSLKGQKAQKERPQVKNINARSTVDEVTNWLDTKGFSGKCIRVFQRYNGEDMFRLKRTEMDRLIGAQEAQRLESHILVQKNKEGYKTARSGGKELQAILQARKEKADRKEEYTQNNPEIADYSDSESDESDNFENAGLTLRAMLRHQRKRISNSTYRD